MITSDVYSRAKDGVIVMKKSHLIHSEKTRVKAIKELDTVSPTSCHFIFMLHISCQLLAEGIGGGRESLKMK